MDGGFYHVFNRGNDRRKLFGDPADYRFFLNKLALLIKTYESVLYHYCLMPNHFHFLLKVQKAKDLPASMHRLQLSYARYFKKAYRFTGHVFQERFRSPRISEESYYLQCGRYIERNPLRAQLVQQPEEYPYSSARFYLRGDPDGLITPNPYYQQMGNSDSERRERYRQFLALEDPYSSMVEEVLART